MMNRDTRLVALALFLWGFGDGLYLYIQPLYIQQLGANPVQIGGLLAAMSVVSALTYLPSGLLSDRLPRKWAMWGGWVSGMAGIFLVGLARTWQGIVPGLLIYAFSAYCIPVINAYLAHAVDGRNLERIFAAVFAGYSAGAVISPAVGGWLAGVTTMRMVYFAAAGLFAISTVVLLWVSPQPVPPRVDQGQRWGALLNRRFLRFAALTWLTFAAMYIGLPLTPNFLADVRGWNVTQVGILGSCHALGMTLLTLLLGRIGDGRRVKGIVVGQVLMWCSMLLLLLGKAFPVLALAYLLRGSLSGCFSLTRARVTTLGDKAERGLLLGTTETVIASALIVAPYVAGWLYAGNPAYPFVASLALIPVMVLLNSLPPV